jgi:hypothetical protein
MNHRSSSSIELPEVDKGTGHTLVHYLNTGQFEILRSASASKAALYKRSVLAYYASQICGISNLESLAKRQLESLMRDLSVIEV